MHHAISILLPCLSSHLILTISWAVSTVYPIFASYRAYDGYATLAGKSAASTVNIGGVSIPLGTMLKRATTSESSIEEDTLNARLVTVQMWMIYWIVNGFVRAVESVLFLQYLPLYSVARLCFSIWLIAPIVLTRTRQQKQLFVSFNEIQTEWVSFSQQGCGLVYFRYVKPLMEGQLSFLYDLKVDEILGYASKTLTIPFLKLAMATRGTTTGLDSAGNTGPSTGVASSGNGGATSGSGFSSFGVSEGANYAQAFSTFSTFSKSYFPSRGVDSREVEGNSATDDFDEYEQVDAPSLNSSVAGLKNRSASGQTEQPEQGKGRWFW